MLLEEHFKDDVPSLGAVAGDLGIAFFEFFNFEVRGVIVIDVLWQIELVVHGCGTTFSKGWAQACGARRVKRPRRAVSPARCLYI